ncbi:uncharacterized protein LOC134152356 [Rhea pennata]|uniref:uncharacterized protein LOC134152356 n=1 Tax=Rhea pennata TaxID=8795 RepID=UPI002E27670B
MVPAVATAPLAAQRGKLRHSREPKIQTFLRKKLQISPASLAARRLTRGSSCFGISLVTAARSFEGHQLDAEVALAATSSLTRSLKAAMIPATQRRVASAQRGHVRAGVLQDEKAILITLCCEIRVSGSGKSTHKEGRFLFPHPGPPIFGSKPGATQALLHHTQTPQESRADQPVPDGGHPTPSAALGRDGSARPSPAGSRSNACGGTRPSRPLSEQGDDDDATSQDPTRDAAEYDFTVQTEQWPESKQDYRGGRILRDIISLTASY